MTIIIIITTFQLIDVDITLNCNKSLYITGLEVVPRTSHKWRWRTMFHKSRIGSSLFTKYFSKKVYSVS